MINTDFTKVERLLLIYPEGVSEEDYSYDTLAPFYDELIRIVPTDIHVVVFVKSREIGRRVKELREKLDYIVHADLLTIWLRDVAGFNCADRIVKPIFRPRYYRGAFGRAKRISASMELVHSVLGKKFVRLPLVWDGGNLVTNGKIGLITERIFMDNPKHSTQRIAGIIRDELDIEPVFVPERVGDPLAHTDGCLAFIKEHTALISEYPETSDKSCTVHIHKIREELTTRGIELIEIKDVPEDGCYYGARPASQIQSARGIYVNYLQLNDTFVLPQFGLTWTDNGMDYNSFNADIVSRFGKVTTINCDDLGKFGGVLHCISFTD